MNHQNPNEVARMKIRMAGGRNAFDLNKVVASDLVVKHPVPRGERPLSSEPNKFWDFSGKLKDLGI